MASAVVDAAKRAQKRAAVENIQRLVNELHLSHVELSLAIGVFAPALGQQGTSRVSAWAKGQPASDENAAMLDLLADGIARLQLTGMDGRRRLFDVVTSECEACGGLHVRHRALDVCIRCGKSEEPRFDPKVFVVPQTEIPKRLVALADFDHPDAVETANLLGISVQDAKDILDNIDKPANKPANAEDPLFSGEPFSDDDDEGIDPPWS